MPAHMAPQRRSSSYCSPAVRKIQSERDLERSKKLAVTANSGVIAKKRSPPRRSAQVPPPPGSASITQARRIPTSAASEQIRAGTTVSVRTPVGKLRGGKRLVLWLSAVVVSAAEEGYLTVVYKGNFPPEDPFQTVRVARQETKKMAVAASSAPATAIATSAAARPSSKNVAAPRPTTGGKKVAVLKRIYPEAF